MRARCKCVLQLYGRRWQVTKRLEHHNRQTIFVWRCAHFEFAPTFCTVLRYVKCEHIYSPLSHTIKWCRSKSLDLNSGYLRTSPCNMRTWADRTEFRVDPSGGVDVAPVCPVCPCVGVFDFLGHCKAGSPVNWWLGTLRRYIMYSIILEQLKPVRVWCSGQAPSFLD